MLTTKEFVAEMSDVELKSIIASYHRNKDYDYFFEACTLELNNRIGN